MNILPTYDIKYDEIKILNWTESTPLAPSPPWQKFPAAAAVSSPELS